MTTPFTIKDAATVRDDILRTLRNGMIARGIANPQLGPGSHEYVLATAVANEFAVVGANTQIKADAQMPDTAISTDLDRLANQYGLARRISGPSSGLVVLSTSANTFIPVGAQLVDQSGSRYVVTLGGTYNNTTPTNLVPVQALDSGVKTNHVAGDVLRWTSTPPYSQPTALVEASGLEGGVDAEGDEALRARLLSRLQNPPNNCNWQQIATIAEASHTAVEKAFVYPACNGPSTVHIAVTAAATLPVAVGGLLTSTSKNRDIDSLNGLATGPVMAGSVVPYIQGQLPEYVESVITSVTNVPNDVAIGMTLPASAAAVPAGPGGGWIDGTPWPSTAPGTAAIVLSSLDAGAQDPTPTGFDIYCVGPDGAGNKSPTVNVTHICFLDPTNWKLYRAKVTSTATISSTIVRIKIDTPFPNVARGNYIWPDAVNAQVYCDSVLSSFAQLGPGEKTSANITRGYRHPVPVNSWPYTLGAVQLKHLSDTGNEVLDVSWIFRTSSVAPALPPAIANPPNIYVPRNVGFYPIV